MRRWLRIAASMLPVLFAAGLAAAADTPRHPDELSLGELAFTMPEPVEARLSSGLRVMLFENHDLPLVTLSVHISMGNRYLPPERHTAYRVFGYLWDEGGAGERSPDEMDARVAALGMSLNAGGAARQGYVTAAMVRDDLDAGAELWRDLLLHPRFDEARLERAKTRLLKDVQGINDNPNRLAATWFWRLLAGPDTPEGRVHSRAGIEAVSRAEIEALYRGFVRPERSVVGVSGDVTLDEALILLEGLLGEWRPEGDAPPLTSHAWERETRPGVYVLPGDFDQCNVRAGRSTVGLTELADDYPEAQLLDFGLGYLRIFYRTRGEGLSYGTTTRLVANADRGEFYVMGGTRPDKVVDLLRVVREEVEDLAERPLDEGETTTARTFRLGIKVRGMETAGDIVRTRLAEVATGFPDDYTERLVSRLQAATPASLAAAAERYVGFGEAPVVVVVGMPEGGPEALEALGWGPVTVLEPIAFGE